MSRLNPSGLRPDTHNDLQADSHSLSHPSNTVDVSQTHLVTYRNVKETPSFKGDGSDPVDIEEWKDPMRAFVKKGNMNTVNMLKRYLFTFGRERAKVSLSVLKLLKHWNKLTLWDGMLYKVKRDQNMNKKLYQFIVPDALNVRCSMVYTMLQATKAVHVHSHWLDTGFFGLAWHVILYFMSETARVVLWVRRRSPMLVLLWRIFTPQSPWN